MNGKIQKSLETEEIILVRTVCGVSPLGSSLLEVIFKINIVFKFFNGLLGFENFKFLIYFLFLLS